MLTPPAVMLSHPEPLTAAHDVGSFSCGNKRLDRWLKTRAWSNQQKGFTAVIVVHEAGRVVGYYGSAPTSVLTAAILRSIRITRDAALETADSELAGPVPCLLLGPLATDTGWTNRGISGALLTDALQRCVIGAQLTGAPAVVVKAADKAAKAFWIRRGFLPTADNPLMLFRSIPDIVASMQVVGLRLAS